MSDLFYTLGEVVVSQAELIRQLTKELADIQDVLQFQKNEVSRLRADLDEVRRENTDLRNERTQQAEQFQGILRDNLVFFVRKHPDFLLNNKIRQIKIVRTFTNMGLRDARAWVETHDTELNAVYDSETPISKQGESSVSHSDTLSYLIRTHSTFKPGDKIGQIRIVRELTGMGLYEAKEYVEKHASELSTKIAFEDYDDDDDDDDPDFDPDFDPDDDDDDPDDPDDDDPDDDDPVDDPDDVHDPAPVPNNK